MIITIKKAYERESERETINKNLISKTKEKEKEGKTTTDQKKKQ